jgi:hypothetical protein
MAKRAASPLIPHWPDRIPLRDLESIRAHFAECIVNYQARVQAGEQTWTRHLTCVQERHALWTDLIQRRRNGEFITQRVRDYLMKTSIAA